MREWRDHSWHQEMTALRGNTQDLIVWSFMFLSGKKSQQHRGGVSDTTLSWSSLSHWLEEVAGAGQPNTAQTIFGGLSRALHDQSFAWSSVQGHWEENFVLGGLCQQPFIPSFPVSSSLCAVSNSPQDWSLSYSVSSKKEKEFYSLFCFGKVEAEICLPIVSDLVLITLFLFVFYLNLTFF